MTRVDYYYSLVNVISLNLSSSDYAVYSRLTKCFGSGTNEIWSQKLADHIYHDHIKCLPLCSHVHVLSTYQPISVMILLVSHRNNGQFWWKVNEEVCKAKKSYFQNDKCSLTKYNLCKLFTQGSLKNTCQNRGDDGVRNITQNVTVGKGLVSKCIHWKMT
jgi:hypothetical protein